MADFEEIFEQIPDGVSLHDAADGSILATNQQFCEMLGYSRAELLDLDFAALHVDEPPYTSERARQYIQRAATEGSQTFEWVDETKSGDPLPVEVHLSQTTIDGNERILAVVRDITERKRRERVLKTERDRASTLFEKLGEPIVELEFTAEGPQVVNVNEAFEETFGVEQDRVEGENLQDIIVPQSERESARSLTERVASGEVVEAELQRQTADGQGSFLLRTVPYSLDGNPRAYGIYFDITERKRRKERFQAFIEQSSDVISILSPDGTYKYLSPSAERILGYEPGELEGQHVFELVHAEDRERVEETFAEAVASPDMVATLEYRFRHGDGSWIWVESVGNYQLDNVAIEGFVVNSRDVTERKEKELELKRRTAELQRQNEHLDEFASVVSHDFRNPLNVAKGRTTLAREECDSEHFEGVERALSRMETLLEDLLTLARQGKTVSETEPVDLASVVERSWGLVKTADADYDVRSDVTIEADESRLRQLVENLLRNAIEHGGEDVTVTVGELEDGFYVKDNGPGIPDAKHEAVFQSGFSTAPDGTGFGLAIVEQIAEAHHWDVTLANSPEGGTQFEFREIQQA